MKWVELGRLATARLANSARGERREVFASLSSDMDVGATYLRRAVAAYAYVADQAAAFGVGFDEVAASVSVVELLVRLTKASPDDAGVHARGVLLGKMSFGSLQSLCQAAESIARGEAEERVGLLDLAQIAESILGELSGLAAYAAVAAPSAMARAVRADLEFAASTSDLRSNVVAIVAPGWKRPAARCTAEEVCAAILAASLAFARVFYVAVDGADWRSRSDALRATRADMRRIAVLLPDAPRMRGRGRVAAVAHAVRDE